MTHPRKLLLLLTPGFAASEADSSCLPLQQALVRTWKKLVPDLEVAVLALHYPYHGDAYLLFGAKVYPFNGQNRGGWRRWARTLSVHFCLDDLYRRYNVHGVVSCWYGETAALGETFARKYSLPHFCWILGQDARPGNRWPSRLALPPERLVALSIFLQDNFARHFGVTPSQVLLPGVEELPRAAAACRDIDVLGVGSLIALKRWTVFLQVAAALRGLYPDIRVVLIGEGPEAAFLQEEVARLGLLGNVRFAGALSHEDVLQHMRRARVLLHSSAYEGYSGVCQEALSVGTPVVSSTSPGGELPSGWLLADSVDAMLQNVLECMALRDGIAPQPFPIAGTARQWLGMFGIGVDHQPVANRPSSPRAIAANEK